MEKKPRKHPDSGPYSCVAATVWWEGSKRHSKIKFLRTFRNLPGATNPTFEVETNGLEIVGERMEDTVHVTAKVWLVRADAPSLGLLT